MKRRTKMISLLSLLLFILPEGALAHQIGGNGLVSGLIHPFLGFDHLLAMVSVGIISTQLGGKAIWKVPATFVSVMLLGALFAIVGFSLPFVETGIALSVLSLGVFIALSKNISTIGAMLCVAFFAIFHGYAHGEELSIIANPALYAFGFVSSTILLHIMGVLIGSFARKTHLRLQLLRYAGVGTGMMGVLFLLGV